jgi:hypothetical protein
MDATHITFMAAVERIDPRANGAAPATRGPAERDFGRSEWPAPEHGVPVPALARSTGRALSRTPATSAPFWGALHGPSPVDRARTGSKHHLLTDAGGLPLAITLTGGNRNDITQLLPLLDAVGPVAGYRVALHMVGVPEEPGRHLAFITIGPAGDIRAAEQFTLEVDAGAHSLRFYSRLQDARIFTGTNLRLGVPGRLLELGARDHLVHER